MDFDRRESFRRIESKEKHLEEEGETNRERGAAAKHKHSHKANTNPFEQGQEVGCHGLIPSPTVIDCCVKQVT